MDPFIAQIVMFGGNFAPRGWAKCEGQLLPISQNTALFSLIGTMYGGDGRTTFALPDMRGRTPIQPGTGPGLSNYNQGPGGGHEQVYLNITNIPSHSHIATGTIKASFTPPSGGATTSNPNGANLSGTGGSNIYTSNGNNTLLAANGVEVTVGNTGGNIPFSVVQPWCAVQFIIALVGIFPSRN
ncbi:phage tail protein [Flavobacterium jejuense]|uniref:Phage tail protein n=1 Tax=Flavobacterium jejuense TaxID=1544455 RepID=A0ABX0J2I3_9FLAO|nr:tail fiber protein [Flavobacterium jejuense]NHN28095.1 phage tail protein [Flavobacterium jejuense]